MDPVPFRSFLELRVFNDSKELMEDVPKCMETANFVQWVLQLRSDPRTRRTTGDVIQQLHVEELGHKAAVWYTTSRDEIFNLWRLLHQRFKPRSNERQDLIPVGCPDKKRRELARHGIGKSKGVSMSVRA